MISSIGGMQGVANVYAAQQTSIPLGAKEGVVIDENKLFSPSEQRTLENMVEYGKKQGMTEEEINILEGIAVHSKWAEKKIGNDISIQETLEHQLKGLKDGYGNGNGLSMNTLEDLLGNFHLFKGANILA